MNYSTYWRTTIFASIIIHFLAAMFLAFVLPKILPEPTIEIADMEWVDVELVDDEVTVIDEEPVAIEESATETSAPEFSELELPPMPEFAPIELPTQPIVEEIPPTPPQPEPVKEEKPASPKEEEKNSDAESKAESAEEPKEKQLLTEPPITINEVNPSESLGYKGTVTVAATIGKDGKVKRTKIMRTAGRKDVDNAAQAAAKQWTFKPALDQEGKPMECDKIITFNYKKLFPEEVSNS